MKLLVSKARVIGLDGVFVLSNGVVMTDSPVTPNRAMKVQRPAVVVQAMGAMMPIHVADDKAECDYLFEAIRRWLFNDVTTLDIDAVMDGYRARTANIRKAVQSPVAKEVPCDKTA